MTRLYGSNDARGDRRVKEDLTKCIVEVSYPPHYIDYGQCRRSKATGSEYCFQHKKLVDSGHKLNVPDDEG